MTTVVLHEAMTFHAEEGPGAGNPIASILESEASFDVIDHSATKFRVEGTASSGFDGWTIVLTASKDQPFDYQNGLPSGEASLQLFDPHGHLALEVTDLHWFYEVFNWATPGFLDSYYSDVEGSSGDDDLGGAGGYYATVSGGLGADTITGGDGAWGLIDGGAGDDVLQSNASAYSGTILGGGGDDTITALGSRAFALGGDGDDLLMAGDYDATLDGGAGNDRLVGLSPYNRTTFIVGQGKDRVEGGGSYDYIRVTAPAGDHYLRTIIDGGAGGGDVTFDAAAPYVEIYADLVGRGDVFVLRDINQISLGDGGADVHLGDDRYSVRGGAGADNIYGGAGSDTLSGGGGKDHIAGGGGEDYLTAGARGAVRGGSGDDLITISGGRLMLDGGGGVDQLYIAAYTFQGVATVDLNKSTLQDTGLGEMRITRIENISGGAEADHFIGSAAANYLYGGYWETGADTLEGLGGNDTLDASASGSRLSGGDGDDRISLRVYAHVQGEFEQVLGGAGDDFVIIGGDSVHAVARGAGGSDTLSLQGGSTAMHFEAADGEVSYDSSHISFAGFERFVVVGGTAGDTLVGGAGADTLSGLDGADSLAGGDGDDVLRSGAGIDTLDGGAGFDIADFTNATSYYGLVWDMRVDGPQQAAPGEMETLVRIEGLIGGYYSDALTGDDRANYLGGGLGADTLVGSGGADTLAGGYGQDSLTGGEGFDTFAFDGNIGGGFIDVIADLEDGSDVIDLSLVDANSTVDGDQAFTLVSAFTGRAGEVQMRELTALNQTLMEMDLNGDGLADVITRITGLHGGFDNFVL